MDRTKSSLRNVAFTFGASIVTMLLQLVNRKVFVIYLSTDYLGLNGLFSDILSMLSISEMGVGAAMIFSLYKPVAEKDNEKIKGLMLLYKKIYTAVGWFIICVGVAITPLLGTFIKDMPDIPYIHVYYIMYVIDVGMSYFYTYKRSLIICNRENYISSMTTMFASVGTRVIQLVVLIFSQNFFFFLLTQIIFTRLENVVISRIADRKYPFLIEKKVEPLDKGTKEEIKKNIFAMFAHKIGSVVVNGTDNIIISKILGLAVLGMFSNYFLLINTIQSIIAKVFNSLTSSIGNLVVEKDKDEAEKVFYKIFFANYCIYGFSTVCFFCLLQPFVRLWLGNTYLLSDATVWVMAIVFYFNGMRSTAMGFREASGNFWHDRYKAVAESIINLVCSIPLTLLFGVVGVKLGTLISMLTTSFWIEGYVLFKYYFKKSTKKYMLTQLRYAILTIGICFFINYLCIRIDNNSIFSFAIECVLCFTFPILFFVLLFCRTEEFKYYMKMVLGIVRKQKSNQIKI